MRQFYTVRWTIRILSILLPGALTALAEYMITGGVAGWAPVVAAVIGGFASVLVLWLVDKRKVAGPPALQESTTLPSPPASQNLTAPQIDGRDFSPRTPAELLASVEGLTEIAAESASQRHIGLWLKVKGNVLNVREDGFDNTITVFLNESISQKGMHLEFDANRWGARLRTLDIGDMISAVGKIESINSYMHLASLSLVCCELSD